MNDLAGFGISWIASVLLGTMFFGGLWVTVQKGVASPRPAFWWLGSLVLRMGTALFGFHFAARGSWERLLFCLLGFFIARLAVTRLTGEKNETGPSKGGCHAPQSR